MVHGKCFGSAHLLAPVATKELRHLALVEIFLNGGVGRRAERAEDEGDLLLLDQLARLLDGLGRAVAVVETDEADLAAVHAALLVQHLEIGELGQAVGAPGRGGAAIGHGLTDRDLAVGHAWRIALLGGQRRDRQADKENDCGARERRHAWHAMHAAPPFARR
jgi:hypothetical protein